MKSYMKRIVSQYNHELRKLNTPQYKHTRTVTEKFSLTTNTATADASAELQCKICIGHTSESM